MEPYGTLRAISLVARIVGWLVIVSSVISVFVVAFAYNPPPYNNFLNAYVAGVSLAHVGIGIGLSAFIGVVILAFGEALRALADIAVNSADMAENSARTVAFFRHVSIRANKSAPSPTQDVSRAA
jgi:hypothetical protein